MERRTAIGIDLGTSNSAIAICQAPDITPRAAAEETSGVKIVPITQVVGPHAIAEKSLLPSAAYLLLESERQNSPFVLPFISSSLPSTNYPTNESSHELVIGEYARERGATIPDRLCLSVKSWLCNHHVDRKAAILPWKSTSVEKKYSPFELSRLILQHLRDALRHHLLINNQTIAPQDCSIVLTVPASFDEVARTLTYQAAEEAGLVNVTLLEEPQAAFYAWLNHAGESWRKLVSPGDIILVCDLGGGTADFSLIAVGEEQGNLVLERISVGEHILLGGDNMDLAIAFTVRAALEIEGKKIDDWQFTSLIHSARSAKERLLSDESLEEISISIPSRGSSLLASTISTKLRKDQVRSIVLDGFFPFTDIQQMPLLRSSVGLQEFGLDYAADAALSKHLARFLQQSATNVKSDERLRGLCTNQLTRNDSTALLPTKVLFNGGVFKAPSIRARLMEVIQRWSVDASQVTELPGADYDLAVAKGAAHYADIRDSGKGLRIRAGLARSYYIGLETSMLAVPGYKPPVKGLCIIPQGTEEGSEFELTGQEFGLITGQPAQFRFFSSSVRAGDEIGSLVANAETELNETGVISLTLPALEDQPSSAPIPVMMHAKVNEVGSLELWMHHTQSERKWKLEFNIRGSEEVS